MQTQYKIKSKICSTLWINIFMEQELSNYLLMVSALWKYNSNGAY